MTKSTKNRDLLSILYGATGYMWRNSLPGKALKTSITNPVTKTVRDIALSKTPEHYKRFAQYLTGGTRGDVKKLPKHIVEDISQKVQEGQLKDGMLNTYQEIKPEYKKQYKAAIESIKKGDPTNWKEMTSESGKKKYFTQANVETYGSIGHAQLTPNEDGTHTLKDRYDVDHDPNYKPLRGTHRDLYEGGQVGSRAYDAAKWLGITGDFDYNVKINNEALKIKKRYNKDNLKV